MFQTRQNSSTILVDSQVIDLNDFTFAQERMDKRFGLIFFMKSKNTIQSLFVKERPVPSSSSELNYIVTRSKIANDHLVHIYGVKQVAAPNTAIQIYFEEFNTDLQQEIQQHFQAKTRFSEAELYNVLYSVIDALCYLEKSSMSHNFITPHNILKFENKRYKIHDNYTVAQSNLYEHALKGHFQRYLAPEYFENLTLGKETPPHCDGQKADIFSLGMCILEAGLLDCERDYINRKLMIIDETALNKSLERFAAIYSKSLSLVLQDMLAIDPSKRPKPSTIYNRLPGKPIVQTQTEAGKKRKFIDRMINDTFPDKHSLIAAGGQNDLRIATTNEILRADKFHSQPKYSVSVLSPIQRASIEDHNLKNKLNQNTIHNYSHIQYYPSSYLQNPTVKIPERYSSNTIHVSDSVKNDPILSKFVTKLATNMSSTFEKHSASLHTDQEKSNIQINYSVKKRSSGSPNFLQVYDSRPKVPQDLQQSHSVEKEAKSFYLTDELGETQKRTYPQNPIVHSLKDLQQQQQETQNNAGPATFADRKPSSVILQNQDDQPLKTSHLQQPAKRSEEERKNQPESPIVTQPSQLTPSKSSNIEESPVRSSPDLYQPQHSQGFEESRTKSKIDDLISKALERSSINLYLSNRVSKELSPALHSPELGSSGEKFYQQIPENKVPAAAQNKNKNSYLNIIDRYQQENHAQNPKQKHI